MNQPPTNGTASTGISAWCDQHPFLFGISMFVTVVVVIGIVMFFVISLST